MANQNEVIQKNKEGAELFAQLEIFSKADPAAFSYFCNKYASVLYDNFDWSYALFHSDEKPAGFFDKFMPYAGVAISLNCPSIGKIGDHN